MSRTKKSVPSYRLHKQSGQAVVTLSDELGNRRDILLGKYDSQESIAEYQRVINEWRTSGRRLPALKEQAGHQDFTVNELALAY